MIKKMMLSVSVLAIAASTTLAYAEPSQELIDAAKKEGQLTTIALPHDWCGYGDLLDKFKAKYGITINELNPEGGSADEVEAIKANKGNTGPQAPDVIDVGLGFGPSSKADGVIQPYKVSTWDSIPAEAKDADGYWYGDYYGVLAFLVNDDLVANPPKTWADLLKDGAPQFALGGDPRKDNVGILGVYAAGLAAAGGDASKAAQAGLEFFKEMNSKGTFVPVNARAKDVAAGTAGVVSSWDYNALAWKDGFAGNPKAEVIVPSDAVIAGVYVQAISAYAPHPNAAKLWMEYLYSDEGQIGFLAGYCHPIRFNDLVARNVVPADLLAKLPDPALYAKAVFPTLDEQAAFKKAISEGWDSTVGADVVK
jgi:putative spermidine/putrescine transport system substrate-binding protein